MSLVLKKAPRCESCQGRLGSMLEAPTRTAHVAVLLVTQRKPDAYSLSRGGTAGWWMLCPDCQPGPGGR